MSLFKPDSLPANMDAISFSFGANSCSSEARPPESWTAALQDSAPEYYGVQLEPGWRERVPTNFGDPSRILVCRWKHSSPHMHERETNGDPDYAIVAITLQPTELELVADGQCLLNGGSKPGMVVVTPPGCPARVTFRSACDFLHLYVPTARLSGIARGATSSASTDYLKRSGLWAPDPAVERLAWLLLKAGDFDAESGAVYMDGLAQAILARLLDIGAGSKKERKRNQSLQKWRLKRVIDLIEADLSRPLRLAELAECAGLSRMHFAAQFRSAIGLQPHEYVLHRRIQRAQDILRGTEMSLAEVALAVGFQTQAHFTTVFRRLSGDPPGRWRQLRRLDDPEQAASSHAA